MADYSTKANVVISVNGDQAKKMLSDLENKATDLKKKLNEATNAGDTKKAKQLKREYDNVRKSINDIKNATMGVNEVMKKLDQASPNQLNKALQAVRRQLRGMMQNDPNRSKLEEQFRKLKSQLDTVNASLKEQQTTWQRFTGWVKNAQGAILGLMGSMAGFIALAKKSVEAYAGMEQEMANVRKYTGMTTADVERLNDEFKKMNTRSSREELNKLAQEAGRLGKSSVEDVLGFVRAADQINVALNDLGDGATLTLSKLTGIFGDEQRLGTEKALLSVGSVINVLSQNCSASAPYLTEFASRLGGVGAQAGLTVQQIMAFGAVLDSNQAPLEKSATALQQLMVKMLQDPAKYAKAAGIEVKSFTDLVKTDMNQALITFLETLKSAGNMDALAPLFADMKEKGSGTVATLATLAGHIDEVKKQQLVANQAFSEAVSVTNEFAVQNSTVQARLEQSKKTIHELMVQLGEKLLPIVEALNTSAKVSLEVLNITVDFIKKYAKELIYLTSIIAAYTAGTKLAVNWTKIWSATTAFFTTGIKNAHTALKAFFLTIKLNPLGMFLGMVTAVIGALTYMRDKTKKAREEMDAMQKKQEEWRKSLVDLTAKTTEASKKEITALDRLYKAATNQARSTLERERAAKRLINQYPEYFKNMTTEQIMLGNAKSQYDKLRDSILEVARAKAAEAKIVENEGMAIDLELQNKELESQRKIQESKVAGSQMNYNNRNADFNEKHGNYFSRTFGSSASERSQLAIAKQELDNNKKALEEIESKLKENNGKLKDIQAANKDLKDIVEKSTKSSGGSIDGEEPKIKSPVVSDKEAAKRAKAAAKKAREEFKKGLQDIKAEELKALVDAGTLYSTGQIDYLEYVESKRKAEEKFFDDSLKFYEENLKSIKGYNVEEDKDYQNLLLKKQETLQKYENQRISYSAEAIRRQSQYEQQELQNEFRWKENKTIIDEVALQEQLLEKKVKYLQQEQALYEKGSKEWESLQLEIEKTVYDAKMAKEEQFQSAIAEVRKKYNSLTVQQQYDLHKQSLDYLLEQGKITLEEYNKIIRQFQLELNQALDSEKNTLPGYSDSRTQKDKNEAAVDLFKSQSSELELAKENGIIDEKNFKKSVSRVKKDMVSTFTEGLKDCGNEWVSMLAMMGESWYNLFDDIGSGGDWVESLGSAMETATAVMSAAMQTLTTFIEAEVKIQTAAIEKRYDAEIKRAEGNTYRVKKLEKQKEDEVAKVKDEANKKMFAMQVIQAVAQTATAAINAYSSASAIPTVGWILGPVAAAMAVAAGMVQIASIKKQQQASAAQGYAEGGFTPAGKKWEEVGVVHAGEWVASQKLVNNPRTRPLLEALDYAQKTNTVGSITQSDVSRSITAPMVLASGTSSSQPNVVVNVPDNAAANTELVAAISNLNQRLNEPFVTMNTVTGDHGIKQAQDEYDRLMKNKSPKYK